MPPGHCCHVMGCRSAPMPDMEIDGAGLQSVPMASGLQSESTPAAAPTSSPPGWLSGAGSPTTGDCGRSPPSPADHYRPPPVPRCPVHWPWTDVITIGSNGSGPS